MHVVSVCGPFREVDETISWAGCLIHLPAWVAALPNLGAYVVQAASDIGSNASTGKSVSLLPSCSAATGAETSPQLLFLVHFAPSFVLVSRTLLCATPVAPQGLTFSESSDGLALYSEAALALLFLPHPFAFYFILYLGPFSSAARDHGRHESLLELFTRRRQPLSGRTLSSRLCEGFNSADYGRDHRD